MKKIIFFLLIHLSLFSQNRKDYKIASYFEKNIDPLMFSIDSSSVVMSVVTVNYITKNGSLLIVDELKMEVVSPTAIRRYSIGLGMDYHTFQPDIFRIQMHGSCISVTFSNENGEVYISNYSLVGDSLSAPENKKAPPD